jgi:hypothetical protein
MRLNKNKLSLYAFCACLFVMSYTSFIYYPKWKEPNTEATISWDVSGYYWYLPSIFIYHDLRHQEFKDHIIDKYNPVNNNEYLQGMKLPNGNYVIKYSSGMAFMYLPFFTIANFAAPMLGYPADGFSKPYQFAIQLGGFLISVLGLYYLRKLLLLFYKDGTVAIVLLFLVGCTNYLNYAAIDNGMSHCWLFTIYVFLMLNSQYYYTTFKAKYAVRIGLLVGLATLTRPSDIISCALPILWGMESIRWPAIKQRAALLARHYKVFIVAACCTACIVSLQLIYWHYVSGHWLVYSYGDQHLYFRSPNFWKYTFNFISGWLTYSPMMLFAFIGLIPFLRHGNNKVAIIFFFLANYYIVCSWNIWWYGGRAMIQSYPVLMFPIASLTQVIIDKRILRILFAPVMLGGIFFNVWTIHFFHKFIQYDNNNVTSGYFRRVVCRWSAPRYVAILKDQTELFEGTPQDEVSIPFPTTAPGDTSLLPGLSAQVLQLDSAHQYSPVYRYGLTRHAKWLRARATFQCGYKEWDTWKMAQFTMRLKNKGQTVKVNMERVFRILDVNTTKSISLDMRLPEQDHDSVEVLIWNGDSNIPLKMSQLTLSSFN